MLVKNWFSKYLVFFFFKYAKNVFISFDNTLIFKLKTSAAKVISFIFFFLKKSSFFRCESLMDYTSTHIPKLGSFVLNAMLLSARFNCRLIVRVFAQEYSTVDSLTAVFLSAGWSEREIYDMMGLYFLNHPDLRRILTDYGFSTHPLKKEYPLGGYGELFYSDITKSIHTDLVVLKRTLRY